MKNQKETIRKMVRYLNNPDKDGGFWLPNIQRSFVWREDQIERLFDSILREYPIGTLLVWKADGRIGSGMTFGRPQLTPGPSCLPRSCWRSSPSAHGDDSGQPRAMGPVSPIGAGGFLSRS